MKRKAFGNLRRGFVTSLVINMLLNLSGSIPAWILLACHYVFGISLVWFLIALGVWIAVIVFKMIFMRWIIGIDYDPSSYANKPKGSEINKKQ